MKLHISYHAVHARKHINPLKQISRLVMPRCNAIVDVKGKPKRREGEFMLKFMMIRGSSKYICILGEKVLPGIILTLGGNITIHRNVGLPSGLRCCRVRCHDEFQHSQNSFSSECVFAPADDCNQRMIHTFASAECFFLFFFFSVESGMVSDVVNFHKQMLRMVKIRWCHS